MRSHERIQFREERARVDIWTTYLMGTLNCINSFMRLLPPIKPNQHFKPSLERLSALPCQLPSNCVQSFADAMSRAGIGAPPSNFGGLVSGVWRSAEAWTWRLLWLAHREVFVIWYRPLQIHYILVTHDCRDISWYLCHSLASNVLPFSSQGMHEGLVR